MPFQRTTKNRSLRFDVKVNIESDFIMHKGIARQKRQSVISLGYTQPAISNHQHTASRSRLV